MSTYKANHILNGRSYLGLNNHVRGIFCITIYYLRSTSFLYTEGNKSQTRFMLANISAGKRGGVLLQVTFVKSVYTLGWEEAEHSKTDNWCSRHDDNKVILHPKTFHWTAAMEKTAM